MANNVKFSTGLQDDLLKRNSDNSYVHKIENGHVYFTTRENDEGETIGSIFYDVNGKRVSMGGGVAEQAKSDDMKQNIADTYVTRISSEGAKYASTDGVTLTTYNGRNAVLDTILLPVAGTDRAGVVITGAQTFAGNKTFTGIIHLTNTRDADSGSDSGVLIIGNKDGSHLILDDNEIMAKNKTNGTGILYLNADGGAVYTGGNFIPNGTTKTLSIGSATAYWKEAYIGNVVTDTLSGHLTGSLTGNVTGNVTGHASLDLPLAGGTMTGDISFATIASWPTASGETYPIKSKGLKWSGSSDNASIYYVVEASDKGALYLDMGDDVGSAIKFAMGGTVHTVFESNGNIYPATTNKGSLGTSSNKFASVYATNFYGIIDKAYGDESGNNIQASYGAKLQAHTHNGSGWSFRLLNKNGGALADTLTVPEATETLAGLMTVNAQSFAGNKTFTGRVHFSNTTDAAKGSDSGVITIGDKNGEHMLLDANEIMVKSNTSTTSTFHIQAEGGQTEIGGNFIPKSQLSLGSSSNHWGNAYIKNLVANTLSGHLTGSLTGNVTGNATSATKLQTARKIILGNDLQGEVSFDGTKDVTFTARSYYCSVNGNNTQNYPWRRIATSGTVTGSHNDKDMVIAIRHSYNGGGYGIAKVSLRTNSVSSNAVSHCEIRWLVRQNIAVDALQAGFRNVAGDTYADIFYKVGTWPRAKVYQLQGDRTWTLISSTEASDTTTSDKKTSSEAYATIAAAATALSRTYTSTIVAYDQGYVERAYKDESGNNIKASYLASIQQVTSDKDTFTFRGFNKNNGTMSNLITIPGATAANASSANWKAGLVTSQAQTWAGNKTFRGDITIQHATVDTMTNASTNPYLKFLNSDGSQGAMIMFTDYDSYRAPAGLKILGAGSSTPAWLEVEGALIVGGATTLNGNLTLKGNLLPQTNNTYTLGDNNYKWKELHTTTAYINETIYVNRCADGSKGGIGLYSTSAPSDYGIAMRSNFGQYGYATDTWNTYFSMVGGATRGWIFRNGGTAIASINGQGKMTLAHSLQSPSVGKQHYIAYPKDGTYIYSSGEQSGYLKITLPQSWTNTMLRFKVSIYNYVTGTSVEYLIGGYNYSPDSKWYHVFAQCIGKWEYPTLSNLKVRFGHDGSKCAIYIGESSTKWSYPQVVISDIVVGYSNYEHNKWYEGWIPSITTTLGTITETVENTNIAYRAYHADRATADESGSNIKANYLARIRQVTSDKDTFTFRGVNKNGSDMNDLITIPAATASGTDNTKWKAGLVTSQAQEWAGTKTFRSNIVISTPTTSTVAAGATNPHIRFEEYAGTQPVYLMYNDHDVYRSPAGLKVVGDSSKTSSPAWFEVEGALIVGTTSTLGGNVTIKGNIMPQADNTYVIGDLNTKWADVYSHNMHIYKTLYVNTSTTGSEGGIALHGTVDPTTYGIAMRSNLGTHGYATDTWNTYFNMSNGATRGWVFRNGTTNVGSINGQGYAQFNKLSLNRVGAAANGRISWYSPTYKTWYTYMANNAAGEAPTGGQPGVLGSVTSWALRSLIQNTANYGWTWEATKEAAASSTTARPTTLMALAADTGRLYLTNDLMIMMGDTDKFVHYLYATSAGATNYVGASWRAGVLGSGSSNTNYYVIQSGTSSTANTTWETALRIGQNNYDFTVGTATKGGIGVANTSSSTGNGISLYGGAVPNSDGTAKSGKPTYGLFFGGTGTFGKHGGVQGNWATYFTMDTSANRGWIFLKDETAVASISNDGITKLGDGSGATASSAGSDTGALRVVGGISTTKNSYFNEKITFPENKVSLEFSSRDAWKTGFFYDTSGHEALVLAMQNPRTSFMIVDSVDPNALTNGTWSTKTPVIQAKKGALYINKLFNGDPSYNLHVEGTANITGNVTMGGTLDVTSTTKIKQGSAATAINTGALQVTGGLSTTAASYMNGALTVNSTINAVGNITAPRFIGLADRATFIDATMSGGSSATHLIAHPAIAGRVAFYYNVNPCTGLFAADNNANFLITLNKHSGNYDSQLGFSSNGNIYYRSFNGSALNNTTGWQMLLTTSNAFGELDGRYVNVSGDTMTGRLSICAQGTGTTPGDASLELREYNRSGTNNTHDAANAPRLGFHWGNRYWAQFALFDNALRLYNSDLSGYYPLIAGAITGDRGIFGGYNNTSYSLSTASFISQSWIRTKGTTGWYGEDYGCHVRPHDGSYGSIRVHGNARNGYEGIHIGTGTNGMTVMSIAGSHQGLYTESQGRWIIYHNAANGLIGIGDSTINGSYRVTIGGGTYNNGHLLMNGQIRLRINGGSWYNPIISPDDSGIWYNASSSTSSTYWGMLTLRFPNTTFSVGGERAGNIFGIYSYNNSRTTNGYDGALYVNGNNHYFYCTTRLYGAVWNDYAEYRETKKEIEPGRVVIETGLGDLILSSERLQPGANITSDTYGFAIGETEKAKTPIAVSGRALVFPYEDKATYAPGDAVCTGPNGTVSKMTREEIVMYPERIVGTVSEIPNYDTWGQEKVKVNGRIWIKVR